MSLILIIERCSQNVEIPAGEPYPLGATPYPWFDFVSPELLASPEPAKSNDGYVFVAPNLKTIGFGFNVVQKVTNWWRRRGFTEVKPQAGDRRVDILA